MFPKDFILLRKQLLRLTDLSAGCTLLSLTLSSSYALQIIKKLIERKQAQIRKVYPGLACFKDGVRQIPIESIPGIRMYRSSCKSKTFWSCQEVCRAGTQPFALPVALCVIVVFKKGADAFLLHLFSVSQCTQSKENLVDLLL